MTKRFPSEAAYRYFLIARVIPEITEVQKRLGEISKDADYWESET